jgi:adenine-specific DNA-methyltransferase
MTNEKLDLTSPNLVNENFEKLAQLFPNCVTESADGKAIDFDLLKQELSHAVVEGNKERYRLEWPGKREAIVTANLPTTKTLRPIREDSVDFDTTENLYIEGDNLEVLKLLQESYLGKIKMIYIDPPYNTGKDFVYKDNFTQDSEEYKEESGQKDEYNQRLQSNPDTSGRYHSDWLSMMYPRLKLARNLLTDDGVIFISIDENEVCNLEKLCIEIFGENNLIGAFPTILNLKGNHDAYGFAETHEYFIVCTKNKFSCELGQLPIDDDEIDEWNEDDYGLFKRADTLRRTGQDAARERRPKGWFPVFIDEQNELVYVSIDDKPRNDEHTILLPINEDGEELSWSWGKTKILNEPHNLIIVKGRNGLNVYKKQRPQLGDLPTKKPKSVFYKPDYSTSTSTTQLKKLMEGKLFDSPKPVPYLMDLIRIGSNNNSIVLDFFSGSASTADAILQLNSQDKYQIKFIQVQIPEATDEKSEAYKAGYKNICEIGKERIRRAAKKIKEETNADIDYGFRVYRLADSNMQDVYYKPQDYSQVNLELFSDNVKPDRTPDDLLAQIMLDWGLPLSLKIEQAVISGKKIFKVAENSLFACFDNGVDEAFAKEIAKETPLRIVFKDSGFKDDTAKTNVKQLLKQLSPETEMKVI